MKGEKMRIKLSDCNPKLREKIEKALNAQQGTSNASQALIGTNVPKNPLERKEDTPRRKREPNKTEQEYNRLFLDCKGRFEAITLRLPGGSRYTPDWMTFDDVTTSITLHEVKGSYRFYSQGRAATAFRECVAAFPEFRFVWAVKNDDGKWDVKKYC